MAPLVTVGVPTFNRALLLERAVESVLCQSHEDLEVVISDNASSDGTPETCARLAAKDPRLRVLRHPVNMGPIANFEAAARAARGTYFVWLADDDVMAPDFLAAALAVLDRRPEASLAYPTAVFDEVRGKQEWDALPAVVDRLPQRRVARYFRNVFGNSAFYGLFRTDSLDLLLPLRRSLGSDWAAVATLAAIGELIPVSPVLQRSPEGASASIRHAARQLQVAPLAVASPYTALAVGMAVHVLRDRACRRLISAPGRLLLALEVTSTICVRYWPRSWYRILWLRWRRKR